MTSNDDIWTLPDGFEWYFDPRRCTWEIWLWDYAGDSYGMWLIGQVVCGSLRELHPELIGILRMRNATETSVCWYRHSWRPEIPDAVTTTAAMADITHRVWLSCYLDFTSPIVVGTPGGNSTCEEES